ncbi:hypothetical protein P280DRAFT_205280 [Massarina eburnea CBS 473.64]|uniref:Golgi apparatus membrane protein TVP38 n=1 Tax=Massarina eburnea CBS 473.64 TaxID=1395130 RepID=A0A6A6RKC5_9PLEO|nr:hypothetical protein P280DRAFT_205280 [Massarina eburnea CBS 473.64]
MPVEEDYDARALALPIDDDDSPERTTSFRRNSSPFSRRRPSRIQKVMEQYTKLNNRVLAQYNRLTPSKKVLLWVGGTVSFVLGILFLVYNERIFQSLLPVAKKWRDITAGWLILWALIFMVSFPPLIGYSSLLTIAGFVYGFPNGWFIAATATIAGSTTSFILSRSLLRKFVARLLANDTRFTALALTLKHDGLKLLIMVRLCPLPYSLSNGAVATFPTVSWSSFALATAIVSPKLMLHIFIGSQLEKIAESGGKMDGKTKALSYVSIAIGGVAGILTGWFMYKKTKQRAAQLEEEERRGIRRTSIEDLDREYADDPEALTGASTLREDDDISLRSGWGDGYHDDPTDTEDDALEIPDDPFSADDDEDGRKM